MKMLNRKLTLLDLVALMPWGDNDYNELITTFIEKRKKNITARAYYAFTTHGISEHDQEKIVEALRNNNFKLFDNYHVLLGKDAVPMYFYITFEDYDSYRIELNWLTMGYINYIDYENG